MYVFVLSYPFFQMLGVMVEILMIVEILGDNSNTNNNNDCG